MRIAYIGHGYHEKTKSTQFMLDYLRTGSMQLDVYADYSQVGGGDLDVDSVIANDYDLYVVFQMERVAEWFAQKIPERLIFIPMYDGAQYYNEVFWQSFRHSRVLNFSRTLHGLVQSYDVPSLCVQYYHDPFKSPRPDFRSLRGFLWQRRQDIGWSLVKKLIGATTFSSFTLHCALDPGAGDPDIPDLEDTRVHNIALSSWYEERAEFERVIAKSNIYFAPRLSEGIGMSFLEALCRGQCVVAPNAPTMSEYITHGVNGLLYDPNDPRPLDFRRASQIGHGARRRAERGFTKWRKDQHELFPDFFFRGREAAYDMLRHQTWRLGRQKG